MTFSFSAPRHATALLMASATALAACTAVGPDYRHPDVAVPPSFHNAPQVQARNVSAPSSLDIWWAGFRDPLLSRLIERALADNLDLAQATARVQQSRAAAASADAALLPQGDLRGSAARHSESLLSPLSEVARNSPGFERNYGLYDLGAAASWEIDLFGGTRREREAAHASAQAVQADRRAIQITVAAEVADTYLQIRSYQTRMAIAQHEVEVAQHLADLLRQRNGEGIASERELHQAQAQLAGMQASIPPLAAGLEGQRNRLDVLIGLAPGTSRAELDVQAAMPAAPGIDVADTPAELLRRRPDIIAAEQRLVAANARIGAAIADYYPKLSISGLLGVESVAGGTVFGGDALLHQVGAGFRWRLFDFGRVDAEVAAARGGDAQALAAYRATVLNACAEVETAFSDLAQNERRADALRRQIAELTQVRDQSRDAYDAGVISLIEVLDADRGLLTASDQLTQAEAGASRAAVASFRALGGGWREDAAPVAVGLAAH